MQAPNPSSPTNEVFDANLIAFVTASVRAHDLRGMGEEPFHDPHGPGFPQLRRLLTEVLHDGCSKTAMSCGRTLLHLGNSVVFCLEHLSLTRCIKISFLDGPICHEGEYLHILRVREQDCDRRRAISSCAP